MILEIPNGNYSAGGEKGQQLNLDKFGLPQSLISTKRTRQAVSKGREWHSFTETPGASKETDWHKVSPTTKLDANSASSVLPF